MTATRSSRAGISLLEVLISIGILAVGLTSVLSFIPAGHSMAKTSLVTDQAAIVAANAIDDLVTQGYLRVDSLSNTTSPVIIDPLGGAVVTGSWTALGLHPAALRQNGAFSMSTTLSPARSAPAAGYLLRSCDDVSFNVPDSDAEDVTNRFVDGVRSYRGNFSWIAMLSKAAGGTLAPGDEVTLTVVVFHDRDANQPPVAIGNPPNYVPTPSPPATPGNVNWSAADQLVAGRKDSEIIRTNGVCLVGSPPVFRRISIAAIMESGTSAFLECDGPALGSVQIYAVPDAVAVIEKTVTLETSGPYSE